MHFFIMKAIRRKAESGRYGNIPTKTVKMAEQSGSKRKTQEPRRSIYFAN